MILGIAGLNASGKGEVVRFLDFLRDGGKDVRVFQPPQFEEALDWLKNYDDT